MYDLRTLRDQFDSIRDQLGGRGKDVDWAGLEKLLHTRTEMITQVETLRHQLKKGSEEVGQLKRNKQPAEEAMTAMRTVGDTINTQEDLLRTVEEQLTDLALRIPNITHFTVPQGTAESDNVEMRRWGDIPTFPFTPKPHWELGESLGILDFERATKIAGARFSIAIGLGAQLERALATFMLDVHIQAHGYIEVLPPYLVNRTSMIGTGQLPKFESDLFHLRDDDLLLIPTAEVPVTNMYRDEILPEDSLPIRHVANTPCFRREAGSYGQDTRGLIRMHQFHKVELVAFSHPEHSYTELERITNSAESILQSLELPYRLMNLCTGDTGFSAAKTYDLEVWLPSQEKYREISSCSNFEGFQARRANIRFRPKAGKVEHIHTLNGSGVALGRTVVAILENYQQEDGSVKIPKALQPYMYGVEAITPSQAK
ncbi:MAG: serine--tRNA ligase [Nitrospirae bacterium]|nr:serine--tRNA ligase [Nitrospirota bacterium]MDA1305401.1 serine--tRNA ligase [Nitrospirota bacterium]